MDPKLMDRAALVAEIKALGGPEVAAVSYERHSLTDLRAQLTMLRRLSGGTPPASKPKTKKSRDGHGLFHKLTHKREDW